MKLLESREYYIAYFDILGYKEYFKNVTKTDAYNIVSSIYESISYIKNYIKQLNKFGIMPILEDLKINFIGFSDNFTFTLQMENKQYEIFRLLSFLSIIADIQRNFAIKYGLLVRGGIVKSEAFIHENIIQGKGIINAVGLESKAVFPQIIIDDSIYSFIHTLHFLTQEQMDRNTTIQEKMNKSKKLNSEEQNFLLNVQENYLWENTALSWKDIILLRSNDEKPFLNYMYSIDIINRIQKLDIPFQQISEWFQQYNPDIPFNSPVDNYCQNLLINHRQMLIDKLKKYGNYNDIDKNNEVKLNLREKIIKKYIWLFTYHKYICQKHGMPEYDVPAVIDFDTKLIRPFFILKS